ncbi:MAG: ATP cone domain-containing protein, partial [Verrucomicrobiota bacterium]
MIESRFADARAGYSDLECEGVSVKKRDGRSVEFDPVWIHRAIEKAFRAELGLDNSEMLDAAVDSLISDITTAVVHDVLQRANKGVSLEIELIQEAVENQLMKTGQFAIARRYILYREERKKARTFLGDSDSAVSEVSNNLVRLPDGSREPLDPQRIRRRLIDAVSGYEDRCSWQEVADEVILSLFNGVAPEEIEKAILMAVRARIEKDPTWSYVAAHLLLRKVYRHAWGESVPVYEYKRAYRSKFDDYIECAIENELIDPVLREFDLEQIAAALKPERDRSFAYLGLQTLFDRYFLHVDNRRLETPQYFWMRVSMGLAVREGEQKNDRAIEFYNMLSTFRFVSSTPTLFNAGTLHPQLSSCYLLTVMDDLEHIFKTVSDDAMLSKWAGGLGNDWSSVRSTGSYIKGTNGRSQGVIPFLKVANDTAVAVNQGGKRKGALCSYLETWHLDIEDFL